MDVAECGWLIIFQPWVFTACIESYICTWDSRQEVPFTSSYTFASFLAKATEVREWILGTKVMNHSVRMHSEMRFHQALLSLNCAQVDWWEQRNLQKLPADDFSTENGVPLRMFDHSRSMFCSVLSVHLEASGACHQEQTLPTDDRPAEPGQCLGQEDGGKSTTQGLRSELQGAESGFCRWPIAVCVFFHPYVSQIVLPSQCWWGYHEIIGTCYWVRSSGPSGECWRSTFAKLLRRALCQGRCLFSLYWWWYVAQPRSWTLHWSQFWQRTSSTAVEELCHWRCTTAQVIESTQKSTCFADSFWMLFKWSKSADKTQVGDNVLDYNPQFMFYITTKLSNPHYTPEVSTKTTIASWFY